MLNLQSFEKFGGGVENRNTYDYQSDISRAPPQMMRTAKWVGIYDSQSHPNGSFLQKIPPFRNIRGIFGKYFPLGSLADSFYLPKFLPPVPLRGREDKIALNIPPPKGGALIAMPTIFKICPPKILPVTAFAWDFCLIEILSSLHSGCFSPPLKNGS